jgi:VWFA-related protein
MITRGFGVVVSLALAIAIASVAPLAPLQAQARHGRVYVTVTDQAGKPVENLGPADFSVHEDKLSREIVSVEHASQPMHIAVLVDNSQAAERSLRDYREGLAAFISAIGADTPTGGKHQIAIITLASRPTIAIDYTADQARLMKTALSIFSLPETGTYLLDGIIEASQGISKRTMPRAVIVAITTEGPELSEKAYEAVLAPLRDSGASLNMVVIGAPRNTAHDRAVVIDQGSKSTGGRNENILVSTALAGTLKQIANDLTHQYAVTYAEPETLIPAETVTVSMNKEGLTARSYPTKAERARMPR